MSTLSIGDTLIDMQKEEFAVLSEKYELGPVVRFDFKTKRASDAFTAWIRQSFWQESWDGDLNAHSYVNRMLMVVAGPDTGLWWTAAWSYDGKAGGIMKIRERGMS